MGDIRKFCVQKLINKPPDKPVEESSESSEDDEVDSAAGDLPHTKNVAGKTCKLALFE